MRPFKSLVGGGGSSSKSSVENSNDNYNNPLIPASELIFEEESLALLGKGGFGSVRKALLKNRNTSSSTSKAAVVAVKSLSISPQSLDPLEAIELFVSEAKKMRELKHTRIVGFIGFVLESFSIVMEFLPSGTLQEFLKTHKRVDVEWKVRCQLAEDVAEGMAYLHSKKTLRGEAKIQVFHQDLKPANVLLSIENDVLRGKISDFGLSAIKDKAANDQSLSAATNIESFVMHLGGSKVYMVRLGEDEVQSSNPSTIHL